MNCWVEETFHPHWRVRLEADEVLHEVKTEHQHLVIFKNPDLGHGADARRRVPAHDLGRVHLPRDDGARAADGDGQAQARAGRRRRRRRRAARGLKHPSVEKATLCEIDRTVIDTVAEVLPRRSPAAASTIRAPVVVIADGLQFVAETDERFDAIIVDSSEPIGPSAVLHTREFFADCSRALKKDGILVTQNGLPFLFPEHLARRRESSPRCSSASRPYHVHAALLLRRAVRAELGLATTTSTC